MSNKIFLFFFIILYSNFSFAQTNRKELSIVKISDKITIDGNLKEQIWQNVPTATNFVELRPTPFLLEENENKTKIHLVYNNDGIYIGGYCYERTKDSVTSELIGRDGFGNNDFLGVVFDTYNDKLNAYEYFVTPLGEQMDAKVSPNASGNNGGEDFAWNAVWKSASIIQNDGWSFEMFIPYSAIRFGKKKLQDWGFNIVRLRRKSNKQLFWNTIDPNKNGFLTQEGLLKNLQDIKPPIRLQLSPYISAYHTYDGLAVTKADNVKTTINGGLDVKYGLNQAFTLDMSLVPDFGQVQSDNLVLNTGPFEQQYAENRSFFTEGTDLFSKGDLFYSRRIGAQPIHYNEVDGQVGLHEFVSKNPTKSQIVNATKISGRTQNGLGVGLLNSITKPQNAIINDSINPNFIKKFETDPLTNYNVFVLDQTLKNNSSISLVNTSVLRSGHDYDANVSAFLFDFNDKKNKWNIGGNIGISTIVNYNAANKVGYTHSIYAGKTSGRLTYNVWHELANDKYDKNDLGYLTNNNYMVEGFWIGYNWNKPKAWYNNIRININARHNRLVTPLDPIKGRARMFQGGGFNFNFSTQTKKNWYIGANINGAPNYNDFYEPRKIGRVFVNKGRIGFSTDWQSNNSKKLSWGGSFFTGTGGVFKRISFDYGLYGKIRFNSKFSIALDIFSSKTTNAPGYAFTDGFSNILFSRRNIKSVNNALNIKYNFTNKMGISFAANHNWTTIKPQQLYLLNADGSVSPSTIYSVNTDGTVTANGNNNIFQNYNYFTIDMVYTWQFAQGSFLNIGYKNIGEDFKRSAENKYY
ncbi:MAG: DUF5916 domain-containing protein, partial [Ferruginibacter sp.]